MKKIIAIAIVLVMTVMCFVGCGMESVTSGTDMDMYNTQVTASTLQTNQPTPTDIEYSLERYNLIRRAYWVNGQREKANALVCPITKPLGYIVLFTEGGGVVGNFVVDGKVSSLNSYLTPDSEYYEQDYGGDGYSIGDGNDWLADVDGSYGENDNGIFFFDVKGNYVEWTGTYLYTDIPMTIPNPVVTFEVKYD